MKLITIEGGETNKAFTDNSETALKSADSPQSLGEKGVEDEKPKRSKSRNKIKRPDLAIYGHGSNRFPPVNIPIPTKTGSKMGGEFTYPKVGSQNGFDNHSHICFLVRDTPNSTSGIGPASSSKVQAAGQWRILPAAPPTLPTRVASAWGQGTHHPHVSK